MRVKVIILIALAVLLIVSSVSAMASYVSTLDQSQLKTPFQGFQANPVYSQQSTDSLTQIDGLVENSLGFSKDLYDSRGSGLLSDSTASIPFLIGQLQDIPGPMDLISAMAPAGYANNTSRLGNHNVKNSLNSTSLI